MFWFLNFLFQAHPPVQYLSSSLAPFAQGLLLALSTSSSSLWSRPTSSKPSVLHTISLAELSFSLEGLHTLFSSEPIRNCLKLSFRKNPAFKSLISSEIVPKKLKILIDFLRDLVESFKPINLISLTLISSFRCVFLETKTHS